MGLIECIKRIGSLFFSFADAHTQLFVSLRFSSTLLFLLINFLFFFHTSLFCHQQPSLLFWSHALSLLSPHIVLLSHLLSSHFILLLSLFGASLRKILCRSIAHIAYEFPLRQAFAVFFLSASSFYTPCSFFLPQLLFSCILFLHLHSLRWWCMSAHPIRSSF